MARTLFSINGRSLRAVSGPTAFANIVCLTVVCDQSGKQIGGVMWGTSHERCLALWVERHGADVHPINAKTETSLPVLTAAHAGGWQDGRFERDELLSLFIGGCVMQANLITCALALFAWIRYCH